MVVSVAYVKCVSWETHLFVLSISLETGRVSLVKWQYAVAQKLMILDYQVFDAVWFYSRQFLSIQICNSLIFKQIKLLGTIRYSNNIYFEINNLQKT